MTLKLTASNQDLVCPVLITELGCIALPGFLFPVRLRIGVLSGRATNEFDSDLLVVQEVGALKNDTKRSFTDFFADTVVDTHNIRRRGRHGCGIQGC